MGIHSCGKRKTTPFTNTIGRGALAQKQPVACSGRIGPIFCAVHQIQKRAVHRNLDAKSVHIRRRKPEVFSLVHAKAYSVFQV